MTRAFVPGGPDPRRNGLGKLIPLTVIERSMGLLHFQMPIGIYREAVVPFSPGLPPRLPWVFEFHSDTTRWGCVLFHITRPNVAAERQRWAGGRNRFAVKTRR